MLEIIRNGLKLTAKYDMEYAEGSVNTKVKLTSDASYSDYVTQMHCGFISGINGMQEILLDEENGYFILPQDIFIEANPIYISIGLSKDDEIIKLEQLRFVVKKAPSGNVVLPTQATWQELVSDYSKGLFDIYKVTDLEPIKQETLTYRNEAEEFKNQAQAETFKIGDLAQLETTDKSNTVNAINEVVENTTETSTVVVNESSIVELGNGRVMITKIGKTETNGFATISIPTVKVDSVQVTPIGLASKDRISTVALGSYYIGSIRSGIDIYARIFDTSRNMFIVSDVQFIMTIIGTK